MVNHLPSVFSALGLVPNIAYKTKQKPVKLPKTFGGSTCVSQQKHTYGYVYMCKDGYTTMVVRSFLVAGYLVLGQFGLTSGDGPRLEFVLLFGEHDVVKPGFLLCTKEIKELNSLSVAISKLYLGLTLVFLDISSPNTKIVNNVTGQR